MKDSEIQCVGKIPINWKIVQVKTLFKIGRGRVISQSDLADDGQYPVYSSQTVDNGILGYINTYDFDRDQLTWTTDGANAGSVFLRKGKHNCTNVCGTLLLKHKENLNYLYYTLNYIAFYHKRIDTNGAKIMNNEMAQIKLPLPPLATQNRIVAYLDKKIAIIDRQIEANKKAIELLGEYRASEISRIVTKGLYENVDLINSGNAFIGKIPKHWKIEKLKYLVELDKQRLSENTPLDYVFRYVDIGSVNLIDGITNYQEMLFSEAPSRARMIVNKNDIIVSTVRTYLKAVALIEDADNVVVSTGFAVLSPKPKKIYEKFLAYYCKSDVFCCEVESRSYGISYPAINSADLVRLKVLIPPTTEQKEIVAYLDKRCKQIDQIIAYRKAIIEKLEEYKKSLIYEAVTGKREI